MNYLRLLLQKRVAQRHTRRPRTIVRQKAGIARLAILLALAGLPLFAAAQTTAVGSSAATSEEKVKAAFIFKFLHYVDWPPGAFSRNDAPFVIGILNDDEMIEELIKATTGRSVNGRAVTVKKMHAGDGFAGVHVLFIGSAEKIRLAQWLRQSKEQPILAITEGDDGLAKGSMINFRIVDERVRFEVALDAVEKAGLKMSSRILAVALSVSKGTAP